MNSYQISYILSGKPLTELRSARALALTEADAELALVQELPTAELIDIQLNS